MMNDNDNIKWLIQEFFNMSSIKPIVVLDADGVLLDYHQAYKEAWFQAFGEKLEEVNANAYSPVQRWGARQLQLPDEFHRLERAMSDDFWLHMQAMDGAAHACQRLYNAGFELICVSALPHKYQYHRYENLQKLGIPIKSVYATGSEWRIGKTSPKAVIVNQIKPVVFVDDFAPFLRGVDNEIHKALIMGGSDNSPNVGEDFLLSDSQHPDLQSFVNTWLKKPI